MRYVTLLEIVLYLQKIGSLKITYMLRKIIKIVASVSLATIVSCSSVKKTITSIKEVEESVKLSNANILVTDNVVTSSSGISNIKAERKNVLIEYSPEYDLSGNLIPFSLNSKDSNGNETSVNIQGNAKVRYFTEGQVEDMVNSMQTGYSKQLDSVNSKVDKVDSKITIDTKDKTKAPDYLKYIIGLLVFITLLFGGIVILYFYFKKKILNITKLIP